MKNYTHSLRQGLNTLTDEARALVDATANSAEDKIVRSRKRLLSALEDGHDIYDRVRDRVVERAHDADGAMREHPYANIGIAFVIGALLMLLLTRPGQRSA